MVTVRIIAELIITATVVVAALDCRRSARRTETAQRLAAFEREHGNL
jgi:hypothetical protein